ncbi:FAD-dependent oxidoreductase [Pendulispora rubella]|uniref:FAD-dependent oxidoreductase n=1 Tax=Pendulispora rubella TaxID=2741070 RepID=A0ABZ2KYN9_9BACT
MNSVSEDVNHSTVHGLENSNGARAGEGPGEARTRLPKNRVELELLDKKPTMTPAEAKAEADRCLYCQDAPCIKACPTEIDIPTFIKKIASDNVRGSAKTIFEQNLLGYSCSRVCPVEVLCVGSCVYNAWHREPIAIGRLQRYATEQATAPGKPVLFTPKAPSRRKVALIGAGPASLSCAGYLALEGHQAVIFEKRAFAGGLNTTGIAPYKLHVEDSLHEVEWLEQLGVEVRTGVEVGKDVRGEDLLKDYDAVYIGVGLGEDTKLRIPGEDGPGVFGATAWIETMKLAAVGATKLGRVLVIGGGNTALDVARECALLGAAEVSMVYRRDVASMSGYAHELEGARKEGVRLVTHATPVAFERDAQGKLTGLRVRRMAPPPQPSPGGGGGTNGAQLEEIIPCDTVALAIGQSKMHAIAAEFPGVALDAKGCIVADPNNGATGHAKVFSGGDCINGGKEVVNAVADGRNTARHLDQLWSS